MGQIWNDVREFYGKNTIKNKQEGLKRVARAAGYNLPITKKKKKKKGKVKTIIVYK